MHKQNILVAALAFGLIRLWHLADIEADTEFVR